MSISAMTPDCPARFCDRDDHAECWADYDRQEDADKYRHL